MTTTEITLALFLLIIPAIFLLVGYIVTATFLTVDVVADWEDEDEDEDEDEEVGKWPTTLRNWEGPA